MAQYPLLKSISTGNVQFSLKGCRVEQSADVQSKSELPRQPGAKVIKLLR
jgi:hypothetical protein